MLMGAIVGDFVGSRFERHNTSRTDFELLHPRCVFTDDTVLTVATAEAMATDSDYGSAYRRWALAYPGAGYGGWFRKWVGKGPGAAAYGSFGNGAAMRVSPVAWAYSTLEEVLEGAARSAKVTHDHPHGVQGAQAIAGATFAYRTGATDADVRTLVEQRLNMSLHKDIAAWRATPGFYATAPQTVPVAFAAVFEASDFEQAIRLAISTGGDSDTIAAMAGSLAEAKWSVPEALETHVWERLPQKMREVLETFSASLRSPTEA